jgi:hypothetical protein
MRLVCCSWAENDFSLVFKLFPANQNKTKTKNKLQLPDGRVVQMGGQRFKSAELLFKPDLYRKRDFFCFCLIFFDDKVCTWSSWRCQGACKK